MKKKFLVILIISVSALCGLYFLHMTGWNINHIAGKYTLKDNELPGLLKRKTGSGSDEENKRFIAKWTILTNTLKENPAIFKARLELAELYMAEARITGEHPYYYPAALKMINSVINMDPKDRNILFSALSLKASVQLSLHQFTEGMKTAKQALAINPYNSAIYGVLVDANVELGDYDEAVKM
ncbi:MAG TPA: hypothetical protein VHI78_12270, partial [Bacteroidales bacterium]|nr:hypothetical protein [Bacteroidales bacterium]